MRPPTGVTPISSERAPAAAAAAGHLRQAQVDRAARQARLPDAAFRRPVAQAEGGLGLERIGFLTQEQQIGRVQFHPRKRLAHGITIVSATCDRKRAPAYPMASALLFERSATAAIRP
jgi:hypothetical protein